MSPRRRRRTRTARKPSDRTCRWTGAAAAIDLDRVRLADATADLPATSSSRSDTAIDLAIAARAAVPDRGASSEPKPTAAIPASPDHRAETAPGETAAISPSEAPAHPGGRQCAGPPRSSRQSRGDGSGGFTRQGHGATRQGPEPDCGRPARGDAEDERTGRHGGSRSPAKGCGDGAERASACRSQAQRTHRRADQPQGSPALCPAELRTLVRRARHDRTQRPTARHACLYGPRRRERPERAITGRSSSLPQLPKRHDAVDDPRSRHKRPMAAAESEPSAPPPPPTFWIG